MSPRLGSLFAGIGGFDLAAKSVGIDTAFTSEFDAACNRVLDVHFNGAAHLGDITAIDGTLLPAVDVLTAGSPCQDFSIAGMRRGLEGERSGLFSHFVRLIDELAPRFALWENVPGALTSKGGADFANVIGALVGSPVPLPLPKHPSGRRSRYAGVAHGPKGTLAWRVLDAQHFGVPQRRQRIIAVLDTQGWDSVRILFPESPTEAWQYQRIDAMRGDCWAVCFDTDDVPFDTGMDPEVYPGKVRLAHVLESEVDERFYLSSRACLGILRRAAGRGRALPPVLHYALWTQAGEPEEFTPTTDSLGLSDEVGPQPYTEVGACLTARAAQRYDYDTETFVPVLMKMRAGKPGGGKGPLLAEDQSLTVATGNDQYLFEPQTFQKVVRSGARDAEGNLPPEVPTPRAVASTLNLFDQGDKRAVDVVVEPVQPAYGLHGTQDPISLADTALTLESRNAPHSGVVCAPPLYRVRRLTPVECERLQGFPDGWTDIEGAKDSHRYKQLGNAVAVPVAEWVLGRIAAVLR